MAFQDNSGDIIFDVVLTDEGRRRLAKGDGTFRIVKFALGDEEINYELFDKTQSTAFMDLAILQTPILEAFTNNTSTMKSKLVSIPQNNLLYLPVVKLNEGYVRTKMHTKGAYMIAVDGNTEDNNGNVLTTGTAVAVASTGDVQGFIFGTTIRRERNYIRVDAGIDSVAVPPSTPIPGFLRETGYMIEIDNRLGNIVSDDGTVSLNPATIDDDNIAQYILPTQNGKFVYNNQSQEQNATQCIAGSRSTYLKFKIQSSLNLRQSNFLFDQLGGTDTMDKYSGGTSDVKYIDTIVKVTGINTGYSVDVPIRFIKLQ